LRELTAGDSTMYLEIESPACQRRGAILKHWPILMVWTILAGPKNHRIDHRIQKPREAQRKMIGEYSLSLPRTMFSYGV